MAQPTVLSDDVKQRLFENCKKSVQNFFSTHTIVDYTEELQPDDRLLDSLARLLEADHMCVAICFLDEKLYGAANFLQPKGSTERRCRVGEIKNLYLKIHSYLKDFKIKNQQSKSRHGGFLIQKTDDDSENNKMTLIQTLVVEKLILRLHNFMNTKNSNQKNNKSYAESVFKIFYAMILDMKKKSQWKNLFQGISDCFNDSSYIETDSEKSKEEQMSLDQKFYGLLTQRLENYYRTDSGKTIVDIWFEACERQCPLQDKKAFTGNRQDANAKIFMTSLFYYIFRTLNDLNKIRECYLNDKLKLPNEIEIIDSDIEDLSGGVHTELRILNFYFSRQAPSVNNWDFKYIGISRLCCPCCYFILKHYARDSSKKFFRGSHIIHPNKNWPLSTCHSHLIEKIFFVNFESEIRNSGLCTEDSILKNSLANQEFIDAFVKSVFVDTKDDIEKKCQTLQQQSQEPPLSTICSEDTRALQKTPTASPVQSPIMGHQQIPHQENIPYTTQQFFEEVSKSREAPRFCQKCGKTHQMRNTAPIPTSTPTTPPLCPTCHTRHWPNQSFTQNAFPLAESVSSSRQKRVEKFCQHCQRTHVHIWCDSCKKYHRQH